MRRPALLRILAVLSAVAASPAFAHAILVDSTPAPNGHVPPGKLAIVFRYNSRIDVDRSKLTLAQPGATPVRLRITGAATPDLLDATADVVPGDYVLRWQVLAVDGHITRGTVPFTVDAH